MVDKFLDFISGKKLIIHNAEFDLSHLNNELNLLGKSKIKNEVIDTLALAREKFPGSPINLDALCKRYNIDNTKRIKHTALIDCELLSKVYINLLDQKEPRLDFKSNENFIQDNSKNNILYFKKVITPSNDELKKHKEYLSSFLKKNYFN